jgi:hypothetical protein
MRDVAIISFAQLPSVRRDLEREEAELVQPVVHEVLERAGLKQDDIGFTVSGSADYLCGRPFSFVAAVDGLQAWPPIRESHVEMDGAWALYEAIRARTPCWSAPASASESAPRNWSLRHFIPAPQSCSTPMH